MKRQAVWAALPVLVLGPLVGCGTVLNTFWFTPMEGGQKVYGGVKLDADQGPKCIREAFGLEENRGEQTVNSRAACLAIGVYLFAVDLPLSAVADTAALPLNLPASYWEALKHMDDPPDGRVRDPEWSKLWDYEREAPLPLTNSVAPPVK